MQISLLLDFIKKHKIFTFSVGILLIGFFIVLILLLGSLSRPGKNPSPTQTTGQITPPPNLSILSVDPENNALINKIYPQIAVTFSKPITTFERSNISLSASPTIAGGKTWSLDQKTLFFTPKDPLLPSTTYALSIKYGNTELTRWDFSTVSAANVSIEDQARAQSAADENVAKIQENILKNYPWYNQLPLQTSSYFVYFEVDKKKFIGQLYSASNQFAALKDEVINKLQSIGVDTSKLSIEWIENIISPTPLPD